MTAEKFQFSVEWQFDLLRYTVKDRDGYKALELYDDTYFSLIEHGVIALALKTYYKKRRKVPGRTALIETLKEIFSSREYIQALTTEDHKEILHIARTIYEGTVEDGDDLIEKTEKFAQFVDLKNVIEEVDLLTHSQYDAFSRKVQKAISSRLTAREDRGGFLIKDIKERQFRRQDQSTVYPTPYRQMNALTNAGGYELGSIIVFLDQPKKFKTGILVNIAREHLKRGKKVLLVDLENGEDSLLTRAEQSLAKKNKREILSGDWDDHLQKLLRKYNRLGGEVVVKRFPAYKTTMADVQKYTDELYREHGFRPEVIIVDYAALLGDTQGTKDDNERISNAFIDIANFNLENKIEHCYTAMHVKREAEKRQRTRYVANDIAKCIDIVRHVHAIYGLNRSEAEEENNYLRLEVVEQRDGKPKGRVILEVDYDIQRAVELSKRQRQEYDKIFSRFDEEEVPENSRRNKPSNDLDA